MHIIAKLLWTGRYHSAMAGHTEQVPLNPETHGRTWYKCTASKWPSKRQRVT